MKRINSLDWLRGLLALSIMAYHLTCWQIKPLDSSSLIGKLGIYGVSMFFILSGLSLALVYNKFIVNIKTSLIFIIRRLFRIWPLLWLAIFVKAFVIDILLQSKSVIASTVFYNATTLFGFITPYTYINTGAWSIGNEVFYYSITPLLILGYNKSIKIGNGLFVASILASFLWSTLFLDRASPLGFQWQAYINPINNLFLYCSGIAIYYNKSLVANNKIIVAILAMVWLLYPTSGNQINIVTGLERIIFSATSIFTVIVFYNNTVNIVSVLDKILTKIGEATYGIYLLHPLIYELITISSSKAHYTMSSFQVISATIVITMIASLLSYSLLEKPLMRFGKKISTPTIQQQTIRI